MNMPLAWKHMTLALPAAALAAATLMAAGPITTTLHYREEFKRSYQAEAAGKTDEALSAMQGLAAIDARNYLVNLRTGWLYYSKGEHAEAEKAYRAAIKSMPSSVEARLGLTLPLMALGRWDELETVTMQIVRVDQGNYYANLRLIYAMRMQRKFDAAQVVINRMQAWYPTDVNLLVEQAFLQLATGNREEAKETFRAILVVNPNHPLALQQLDMAVPVNPAAGAASLQSGRGS